MAGRRQSTRSMTRPEVPLRSSQLIWDSIGASTERSLDALKRGLAVSQLQRFIEATGLPQADVLRVLKLTGQDYRQRIGARRLKPLESERLWRLARVFKKAVDLFEGDSKQATHWLVQPQRALRDASPLRWAATEPGASVVEDLIGRIEFGVPS